MSYSTVLENLKLYTGLILYGTIVLCFVIVFHIRSYHIILGHISSIVYIIVFGEIVLFRLYDLLCYVM